MTDERIASDLRSWLRQRDVPPPDSTRTAAHVVARLPRVRRRGRWWLLPALGFERRQNRQEAKPEPWTRGLLTDHFPTVTGRTRLMLSPVKATIAGALVLAVGGMFLVAQPFSQPGGVPGAEQGAELMAPVYVTTIGAAAITCDEDAGYSEEAGPVSWTYGMTCTVRNQWTDPRLQGTETYTANGVDYWDESELYVGHYTHNIVTDEGVWRMRPQFRFDSSPAGGAQVSNFTGTWVLDGEGAYDGLSVVLAKGGDSGPMEGFIVSTDMLLPAPENASTR